MSEKFFVFNGWNKTFLIGGLIIFVAGLVMAYLKSPRHDFESTLFWVFLVASFVILGWCLCVADDEKYVRYFALAFTLSGLLAAFYPLMDARNTLQKPGVIESLRALIAQPFKNDFVLNAEPMKIELKGQAVSMSTGMATLTVHPLSMPLPDRMTLLETQVSALEAKQAQEAAAIRRDAANAQASAEARYETQVNAAKQLRQLIEDLQTGGLAVIWWGLLWLFIGGVLAGLAPEAADFVKWLHK